MAFAVDSPPAFGSRGLKLFSQFLSYLSLLDKFLPCMGFDSSHSNFHLVEEVMSACLEQHGQRHSCRAHERKVWEHLYIVSYRFSPFLDSGEELVLDHLSIILIELR